MISFDVREYHDTDDDKLIEFGQHDEENLLNGFGRKIRVFKDGRIAIQEGMFKDGIVARPGFMREFK